MIITGCILLSRAPCSDVLWACSSDLWLCCCRTCDHVVLHSAALAPPCGGLICSTAYRGRVSQADDGSKRFDDWSYDVEADIGK